MTLGPFLGFLCYVLDTKLGAISWRVRPSLPWCFGVAEYWQKTIVFNRVSEWTLDTFLLRFRGVSVLHCHGVFWCGGGLFAAPEAVQREKVGKIGKRLFLILAKDYL